MGNSCQGSWTLYNDCFNTTQWVIEGGFKNGRNEYDFDALIH